jgi:hypothetical protein
VKRKWDVSDISKGAQEIFFIRALWSILLELRGKTAVIIGVGGIGSQIAQRAHGFGMTVIGVDPKDIPLNPDISRVVSPDRVDTVLPLADVVFISAPHTPQSEGMIGPKQFELMKKGAYFIAVSRGKLYNTDALVKALDERRLAGAGLDVTNPEPLPKGHALWKFENVIITPHIATCRTVSPPGTTSWWSITSPASPKGNRFATWSTRSKGTDTVAGATVPASPRRLVSRTSIVTLDLALGREHLVRWRHSDPGALSGFIGSCLSPVGQFPSRNSHRRTFGWFWWPKMG